MMSSDTEQMLINDPEILEDLDCIAENVYADLEGEVPGAHQDIQAGARAPSVGGKTRSPKKKEYVKVDRAEPSVLVHAVAASEGADAAEDLPEGIRTPRELTAARKCITPPEAMRYLFNVSNEIPTRARHHLDEPSCQSTLYYYQTTNTRGSKRADFKFGGPVSGEIHWSKENPRFEVVRVVGTKAAEVPQELCIVKYELVMRNESQTFDTEVTFNGKVFVTNSAGEKINLVETIEKIQQEILEAAATKKRSREADEVAEYLESGASLQSGN
mmetsp:Transcript_28103/g.68167  ORF Transcript_28103/g.68167 Transcript_28103/m.68167 type:complete len:272 (-) Transcript_28103:274-1089(-)